LEEIQSIDDEISKGEIMIKGLIEEKESIMRHFEEFGVR
jgi:hypothetical protein